MDWTTILVMIRCFLAAILIFFSFSISSVFASDDSVELDQYFQKQNQLYTFKNLSRSLSAEDVYRRTQTVFGIYRVQPETNFQADLNRTVFSTTAAQFSQLLRFLDPALQYSKFYSQVPGRIQSFYDRDAKKIPEYALATGYRNVKPRLRFQGLRVALDPGHMGGDEWDTRTGKFVRRGNTKISEGLIALQTALLLEQRLKALGAQVMITHRSLAPASNMRWEDLDLESFGRRELRARSLEPWFQSLINNSSESELESSFENSGEVKKIFSESMRRDYFAMREDLDVRNQMMKAFRPDITLVIHFNANVNSPDPSVPNKTFAYVPGAFFDTEFATGEARAHFMQHLAQGAQFLRSVQLSSAVVGEISRQMRVPLSSSDSNGVKIQPGVFSRNLMLTRLNVYSPVSYIECLHYGATAEFNRLINHDGGSVLIDGRQYGYSSRLPKLADAILDGIEKYVVAYP